MICPYSSPHCWIAIPSWVQSNWSTVRNNWLWATTSSNKTKPSSSVLKTWIWVRITLISLIGKPLALLCWWSCKTKEWTSAWTLSTNSVYLPIKPRKTAQCSSCSSLSSRLLAATTLYTCFNIWTFPIPFLASTPTTTAHSFKCSRFLVQTEQTS